MASTAANLSWNGLRCMILGFDSNTADPCGILMVQSYKFMVRGGITPMPRPSTGFMDLRSTDTISTCYLLACGPKSTLPRCDCRCESMFTCSIWISLLIYFLLMSGSEVLLVVEGWSWSRPYAGLLLSMTSILFRKNRLLCWCCPSAPLTSWCGPGRDDCSDPSDISWFRMVGSRSLTRCISESAMDNGRDRITSIGCV